MESIATYQQVATKYTLLAFVLFLFFFFFSFFSFKAWGPRKSFFRAVEGLVGMNHQSNKTTVKYLEDCSDLEESRYLHDVLKRGGQTVVEKFAQEMEENPEDPNVHWAMFVVGKLRNDAHWLHQSALRGNAWALVEQGVALLHDNNDALASECMMQALVQGDNPKAFYILGKICFFGPWEEHGQTEAIRYYQKAAELGWGPAAEALANIYQYGHGVEANVSLSIHYSGLALSCGQLSHFGGFLHNIVFPFDLQRKRDQLPLVYTLGLTVFRFVADSKIFREQFGASNRQLAKRALQVYLHWTQRCRQAALLVRARFRSLLGNDVSKVIGELVWASRRDLEWFAEAEDEEKQKSCKKQKTTGM